MQFEEQYPNKPPAVKFISQMFHPNVYATGELCLDILQNRWSPTYDVAAVLTSIQRCAVRRPLSSHLIYHPRLTLSLQFAKRSQHRVPRERRSIEPVSRKPERVRETRPRNGGEILGGVERDRPLLSFTDKIPWPNHGGRTSSYCSPLKGIMEITHDGMVLYE